MAYVQSSNKVYALTTFDYNDLHVLLLTLNASDGTYTSNPYIWNSNWNASDSILYNEDKLYTQIICNGISIMSVFDILAETFKNYEFDSVITNKEFIISPVTSALIMIGFHKETYKNMYYSTTLTASISDNPDISISSLSVSSTSNYASFDDSFTITDMGNFAFTSITPVSSNAQIIEDSSYSYASDVVYYYDSAATITVNTLTNFESTINTIWSSNGSTSVSYNLVANGNDTQPTWVLFNQSNFKIYGTSPELNATTLYTLLLESRPSGSENAFQTSITINVTYEWEVSNWYYCYPSNSNSWKTCADGYILYHNEKTWTADEVSEEVENMVIITQSAIIFTATVSAVRLSYFSFLF